MAKTKKCNDMWKRAATIAPVRFDGWQNTTAGAKEVKKELRKILWMRYKLKDQELFDKAYGYIEMYY